MDFIKIIDLIVLSIPLVACYSLLENIFKAFRNRKTEQVSISYYILFGFLAVLAFAFAYYLYTKRML